MAWMLAIGEYDSETDTIIIEGVRYSGEFFRAFGREQIGRVIRIVDRSDGILSVNFNEGLQQLADSLWPLERKK